VNIRQPVPIICATSAVVNIKYCKLALNFIYKLQPSRKTRTEASLLSQGAIVFEEFCIPQGAGGEAKNLKKVWCESGHNELVKYAVLRIGDPE
jgi:hypothetical protein